jgi:hypothetical protein
LLGGSPDSEIILAQAAIALGVLVVLVVALAAVPFCPLLEMWRIGALDGLW